MAVADRRRRRRVEAAPTVQSMDGAAAGSGLAPQEAPPAAATEAHVRAARAEALSEEVITEPRKKTVVGKMSAAESRALAAERAAEILEHDIGIDDDDKYYVDPSVIPDGWKYLWRRVSVYGKEDPQYQVRLAQTGWRPVPADRHPEMMPSTGGPYLTIDRDGQRLMEIPLEIYTLLAKKEQRKAIEQVRVKTDQLDQAPPGHFARDQHEKVRPQVRRGYEPLIVPDA